MWDWGENEWEIRNGAKAAIMRVKHFLKDATSTCMA